MHSPVSSRTNPLVVPSPLPFEAPEFDRILDADFEPAIAQGIEERRREVEAIATNPAAPTFDNTIVRLEQSGRLLNRVRMIFGNLTSANTNPTLQRVQEEQAPKLSAADDEIFLNGRLFERIEAVHAARQDLGLETESLRLVEHTHQRFVLAGARLSPGDKARLKALNEEDATLQVKFRNRLLAAAKDGALIVSDRSALDGLSDEEIAAAAETARERGLAGRWALPLHNTTQQPALASLRNRETRRMLFEHAWRRTERGDANDTGDIICRLADIRAESARLLGFPDFAAWALQDQMAKTPAAVNAFLDQLVPPAVARARVEADDLQAELAADHPGATLEPWDWPFYAERIRKAQFDLDEAELKPYLDVHRVLTDGVFFAATELYGLSFVPRPDLPVYHEDVQVWDIQDADGAHLALFYVDLFARDNKAGGAWMDNYRGQSTLLGERPIICNVGTFPKPAPGQPALIAFDDVITLFHEFGHALHGLFANGRYPSLSGTAVARDFVELPSQFNEYWALEPRVLEHYAVHHDTGARMPAALVEKIRRARDFNAGYDMTELLAAAQLDLYWHTLDESETVDDVEAFEKDTFERTHLDLPQVPTRYRSSYFLHIWANGYAAGYYAYLWSRMLCDDAFAWFDAHGGLTRENGDHFRRTVLARGNTEDYGQMYRDLTGRDPDITPMLKYRGLAGQ